VAMTTSKQDDTDARLQAIEHNLEALTLQVARIEKALDDLATWADATWLRRDMADTIRRALNHLRP